jgi:putative ABC transport system ATP-binding protein
MAQDKIIIDKVARYYRTGSVSVAALRGVSFTVQDGEFMAIMGRSGSGKSTLMNVLGCLDRDYEGSYTLDGVRVDGMSRRRLADIRNSMIGFVFQGFNLLPRTSALENVELPLLYDRSGRIRKPRKRALEALERVGLGKRYHHVSTQLSGGEQQRVAIARAIVNEPSILLADEPTGNLDTKTSLDVMALFEELNQQGMTIVLVTHEPDIAQYSHRVVELMDGDIISDRPVETVPGTRLDVQVAERESAEPGGVKQ